MIEPDHEQLSVREQCDLLGLHRSTLYYQPRPVPQENERLMRRIDELHTAHITWGSRKIRDALESGGLSGQQEARTASHAPYGAERVD